jgi:tripartite-type tricarboxylate transporter receptor subunit TctC
MTVALALVKIIVPYAAGGSSYVVARIAGQQISTLLGQFFGIVDIIV